MSTAIGVGSAGQALAFELAAGLRDAGWTASVVVDGRDVVDGATHAVALDSLVAVRDAFADIEARDGDVAMVVHAFVPPPAWAFADFDSVGDETWDLVVTRALQCALTVSQAAHGLLRERGGAVVVLTPAISLSGAVGLAPLVTAAEGVRMLARSAARRWGADGVVVNDLAVSLEVLVGGPVPGFDVARHFLHEPALGRPGDARRDVAPVLALLGADPARFVTGATIPVDGGLVMVP
jgi:NAD(P)-dependent dehydrogenase (short-subunit alcohol dehydrogenase family)